MRFPKRIRYRRVEATIYGKTEKYPFYRLIYYVVGKRVTRSFKSYGEAKTEGERLVREIAVGSQATALTGEQSRDALAALERLETFRQSTGRRFSLLAAASEFAGALEKLKGRNLNEAVDGFRRKSSCAHHLNLSSNGNGSINKKFYTKLAKVMTIWSATNL